MTPLESPSVASTIRLPKPACQNHRPRLGFLGVGWIGRNRLEAVMRSGAAEITAIADASPELAAQAAQVAPAAELADNLAPLLELELDGIVIATPSALHAEQARACLEHGIPVFCQKPLGRSAAEARAVVATAKANDLLLAVDLSYRFLTGVKKIHELCRSGELGRIYAVDLQFHNAYGPDKAWFYDRRQSGGGCLLDLGIHLVDLALWNLDFPLVEHVTGRTYVHGTPLNLPTNEVEDYAVARMDLRGGASVQLACSWKLAAGCDALISGTFYGTKGGAGFRNVDGSFYEFIAERFHSTRREILANAAEEWGGRAVVDWVQRLARGEKYDPQTDQLAAIAEVLDRIYQCSGLVGANGRDGGEHAEARASGELCASGLAAGEP